MIGDWNGDGRSDLGVFRRSPSGSSFFYWANETSPGVVNFIPWGLNSDFSYVLDYDGDGRLDPAVQRDGGANQGQHWILQSSNGAAVLINYGFANDTIAPGDYDGDGRDDICLIRQGGQLVSDPLFFYILESDGGGNPSQPTRWGLRGSDDIAPGDYDGDGRMDIAIWRSSPNANQSAFYILRSSDGQLQVQAWGREGDLPVNSWNTH